MLTLTDAQLAAGAGFIVVVARNMRLMPRVSKNPQAMVLDVGGHKIGLD
jgi:formyltetrahydrofolate synthetase